MKVLAFMTQKGGTGKTTLAASVGVAAQQSGERVFLIDLDPQGSLANWGERRQAEEPAVDRISPDKLSAALKGIEKAGYTLAIIDTQGVETSATSSAMRIADLSLIPAKPSALDLEASRPTFIALDRLKRPLAFVLNQCPPGRNARAQDAAKALSMLGVLALPFIGLRADHQDALAMGLGVTEMDPNGKAAEEIQQLWSWIKNKMEGKGYGKASASVA